MCILNLSKTSACKDARIARLPPVCSTIVRIGLRVTIMESFDKVPGDHIKDVPDRGDRATLPVYSEVQEEKTYAYSDSRKLGVPSAVFLILNKMIGTGIFSTPSAIFAATGSVGVSLMLWVIGE